VNRARLRELGFELGARAEGGVSDGGAWFATAPDGAPVVLKWFPDETVAERDARPGRSTTTPMTCPASSTAPSASSIGTTPRRRRPGRHAGASGGRDADVSISIRGQGTYVDPDVPGKYGTAELSQYGRAETKGGRDVVDGPR
jgi:hypothetical protein